MKKIFTIAIAFYLSCFTLTAQTKAGKVDTMSRKAFTSAKNDNRVFSQKEQLKRNVLRDSAKPVSLGSSQRNSSTLTGKETLKKSGRN